MNTSIHSLTWHSHDVLIIGAGGAGLRAAIEAAGHGVSVGVVTKVPPTRSHTVAAQGGINAALGNVAPDDWRWHMYDTIRGSDWLGDQDSIAFMCREAPKAIHELDQMGVAFSRDKQGNIYQRAYGGMSTHFGKGEIAFRACAAADQTGDAIMRGLYGHAQRQQIDFYVEFMALDLLMTETGECRGVLAWELATGQLHVFVAPQTILATGGFGQVYAAATSSSTCTGDGNAMVLRAGLGLQDMEYVQFHPTGLHPVGILISEAARSEGGYLLNGNGERFMERYAPKYLELASRDVVTRAIIKEIQEGRGAGPQKDYVLLDITHLSEKTIDEQLPVTRSLAWQFASIDVTTAPIPVYPTAHYTMGGIPTNRECEVLFGTTEGQADQTVPGLYAIGEAACNSVHGANRLGCNSLLDLVVFGKYAGQQAASSGHAHARLSEKDIPVATLEKALSSLDGLLHAQGNGHPQAIRRRSGQIMQECAGIIRHGRKMQQGLEEMQEMLCEFPHLYRVEDKDLRWNNQLMAAIETKNLLEQAVATLASAAFRTESRGAHFREDFPLRDDDHWMAHSMVTVDGKANARCSTRQVRMDPSTPEAGVVLPEERVY